jgi:ubiquinone/menaquinone biosynthesis C-methylase UbiE
MKSNIEWEKWGERDPLYAVSTWKGKERGSPDAWTDAEFYELGRSDWADFLRQWQHYGLKVGSCVEIGCGAGRITKQLAQCFQSVTGLDVSQHQLDYARAHIDAANVTLKLSNGRNLPVEADAFDAAFSVHVFQHFESHQDAFEVFSQLYRALGPGATLMVHLPVYELPDSKLSAAFKPVISMAKRFSDYKAALDRRHLQKGNWKPVMRRLRFDRQDLISELRKIGFQNIEFRIFAVTSNMSYHEFVFAKKAGGKTS